MASVPPSSVVTSVQLNDADVTVMLSAGRSVRVQECKTNSWEGGAVWPPALLLAEYLDTQRLVDLTACRVLELGAGCGVVGLVASRLGAKSVTLTDLAVALPTLSHNVGMNAECRFVTVCELDWRTQSAVESHDLIIASECIYDADMAEPLLRTMHRASAAETVGLLAGIIGGAALDAFRKHASAFFEDVALLPPFREGDAELPASRGVHMLKRPRPQVNSHR